MGVAGSGKTSVGKGLSLNDSDRKLWINLLSLKIKEWNSKGDAVLACSALKKDYRLILSQENEVTFIFLDGDYDLIYSRLSKRKNHFFTKKNVRKTIHYFRKTYRLHQDPH